jgi:LysM repeat protein
LKSFFKCVTVAVMIMVVAPIIQANNDVVLNHDLEYINADLQDVIRDLAEIGGFRVILDRQVLGEVSLTLMRGVTARDAIGAVAKGYGYSSRWLNNSALMIGTTAYINGNFAARSTRIHTLKHADPVLVAEKLQTIISRERIKIDHQKKELTVTADTAEHQNISDLVNRLDNSNSSINLEIRVEELTDSLWRELRLETDLGPIELGAVALNSEQQKLLQGNFNQSLLSRSDLTCFNNQEARVLIGDYLINSSQASAGANKNSNEDLETGTRLIITPSVVNGAKLILKVNTTVKNNNGQKQTVVRGIHSLIGMNLNQTVLLSGALQRHEYLKLKQTSNGCQYPILENMFAKSVVPGQAQASRIVLLITPKPADGSEAKDADEGLNIYPGVNVEGAAEETAPSLEDGQVPEQGEEPVIEGLTKPGDEKPLVIFDAVVIPENQSGAYNVKYLVKPGDTPTSIAEKFGADLAAVFSENNISSADLIQVGTELVIPTPVERIYMVKPKETLWRIAKRYGTTIQVLMDLNGIDDETKVKEGQALVLPSSARNVANPEF